VHFAAETQRSPRCGGELTGPPGRLQNEAIRGRYLELEDAWQGMIEENKRVHATNDELREQLSVRHTPTPRAHCCAIHRLSLSEA
jgi:hypothetical protein